MKQRDCGQPCSTFDIFFSVSYDPITLEYNQDTEGETLRYMDDIVKWKVRQTHALSSLLRLPRHFIYTLGAGQATIS